MKLQELLNESRITKAGAIPYVIENDEIVMNFMISSDAAYGGPLPQIAKGHIDSGESPVAAGIREAEEELGLKRSNIMSSDVSVIQQLQGYQAVYHMQIIGIQVKNRTDFNAPHYETEKTVWMTLEEFQHGGRKSQYDTVKLLHDRILAAS